MKKLSSLLLTGLLLAVSSAHATFFDRYEPPNTGYDLKTGYPLQVQDAFAVPTGEIRPQSTFQFDRRVGSDNAHGDVFSMKPEVQWGIAPFAHLRAEIPIYTGSGPTSTSGDFIIGGFYNFLDETNGRPAMGISADIEIPTGTHSRGIDPMFFYYVTKSIGTGNGADRIHANIGWIHNSGAFNDERDDLYVLRAGYSRKMFVDTVVGIDFVREKLRQHHVTENVIEIGALHRLTELLNLSVTLGVGVADESPDYRLGAGVQFRWH
ncbi:MAG: hypothetical protein JWO95_2820 [Verrucomicrobiales bacterium]|nr:hypothetical protein [Verrucomicrobiales bacterium]